MTVIDLPGGAVTVIDESMRRLPAPPLRPFVEWYAGYRQDGVAPARHRGLPSPALTFIVTLDDPLVIAAHPDPGQPPGRYDTLLGGLHTTPALITHEGRQSGVQFALTPLGARALLGIPAAELANLDVDATEVLGRFAGELRERLHGERTWAARFAVVDEMLGQRAAAVSGVRPEVSYAWHRLRSVNGAVPVSALAGETGWSTRYLNAQFRAETGLAPKAAARVFRFQHARYRVARECAAAAGTGRAEARRGISLARVAADCGYYDQAHLAREFRALAGCPPSQWLAEEFRNVQVMLAGQGE